jgi:hypothetical protein
VLDRRRQRVRDRTEAGAAELVEPERVVVVEDGHVGRHRHESDSRFLGHRVHALGH